MKLVAIFHCWDDWKLLRQSVDNMRPLVDGIIVIGSFYSNFKEYSPIPSEWHNDELFVREPKFNLPLHSETDKRNYGIEVARSKGYTHFITCDADEMYKPEEFLKIKERFLNPDLKGIVCPSIVYFKSPLLSIGRDVTLVPHIHVLTSNIRHAFNKLYPFAWSGKQIRIDPSRSLNINSGVEYTEDIELHHFSYIREDLEKKIRNSTARGNLERSTIREDFENAKPGYFCKFYQKTLIEYPDYFKITDNFSSVIQ